MIAFYLRLAALLNCAGATNSRLYVNTGGIRPDLSNVIMLVWIGRLLGLFPSLLSRINFAENIGSWLAFF
jgi:hypothetical protein